MNKLKQYLPLFGMVLAVVLQALYVALQDNRLSLAEGLAFAITLCGAITTYVVPRLASLTWLKPATAAVTAALVFLTSAIADGISPQDWIMTAIQALVGLGVVAATNKHVPVTPANGPVPVG